ncbi:MAG: flagellar biosynthesis repressor FlbT [Proteobacteria bacterium]|nr:flagellar biosynthesis repressor FlbT [Pseudomonadota bacterium]
MSGTLQIGLRAGDKIYINGAVIRVDRKVRVDLLNDATFLLGSHVMQLEDATTPVKQVYFLVQGLLMDPSVRNVLLPAIESAIQSEIEAAPGSDASVQFERALGYVRADSPFDALKLLRGLLAKEQAMASPPKGDDPATVKSELKKEIA